MALAPSPKLRALLQDFVDARVNVPDLFARSAEMLPAEVDATEEILELLAEADLKLRLPPGRQTFVRRLQQFAAGESSYAELGLWCFSLGQTEALSPDAPVSTDPEITLLRALVEWVEEWEDEAARPEPDDIRRMAQILVEETNPAACLERLEEVRAGWCGE